MKTPTINEIYDLFTTNLPEITRSEETVKRILSDEDNQIFFRKVENTLAGVSVINDNTIYLLCVDKAFQNRGIGTGLLRQSEDHIKNCNHKKITLGAGKEYIMPGVPMNNDAHNFFISRGYTHSWGDSGCLDMDMILTDYDCHDCKTGDTINDITYRWAAINDLEDVVACVTDGEENFAGFFNNNELYKEDSGTRVLIAVTAGEIAGALMVDTKAICNDTGTLNCAVTVHKHRNKGIATNLVRLGTKHLKDSGLKRSFLSYTYTEIMDIYGRVGYKVYMEYFMGEKALIR